MGATTTFVSFACPKCGMALRIPRERVPAEGLRGSCPGCKSSVWLGADGSASLPDRALNQAQAQAQPQARSPAEAADSDSPPSASPQPAVAPTPAFLRRTPHGKSEAVDEEALTRKIRSNDVRAWDLVSVDGGESYSHAYEIEGLERYFGSGEHALDAVLDAKCWDHRNKFAAFVCERCGRSYCESCSPRPERLGLEIRMCPVCEGLVKPADPRWRERPFWDRLDEVVKFPISDFAWATTIGIGGLLWIGSMGLRGIIVYLVGLAYLLHVISRSAKGDKKMGLPEITDPLELAGMGLAAVVVTVVVAAPLVLFNVFVVYRIFGEGANLGTLLLLLLNLPLGALAFAYYPMALGMSAVWHNKWLALRPGVVLSHILRIKQDYAVLLGFCFVITGMQWTLEATVGSVPFFGSLFASVVSAYLAIIEGHIIGWTLYLNADELGWA